MSAAQSLPVQESPTQILLMMNVEQLRSVVKEEIKGLLPGRIREDHSAREWPLKRSDVMKHLEIGTPKTFNKWARERKIKSVGRIGSEPAYYLSDFFDR